MRPVLHLTISFVLGAIGCAPYEEVDGTGLAAPFAQLVVHDANVPPIAADAGVRLTLAPTYAQRVPSGEFAFPASARPPRDQSPGFHLAGVPASAKSLAVTFRDLDNQAVKWVLWNLAPTLTALPPAISGRSTRPPVPAGASQLGSVGNRGYAGPCCAERRYEWVLWALDVAALPDTRGLSTVQIYERVLPRHVIARSEPILMRIQQR